MGADFCRIWGLNIDTNLERNSESEKKIDKKMDAASYMGPALAKKRIKCLILPVQ